MKAKLAPILAVFSIFFTLLPSLPAQAAPGPYGRDYFTTYFTGEDVFEAHYVFFPQKSTPYAGITPNWNDPVLGEMTLARFLDGIKVRLYDDESLNNQGRAAAVVCIILGKNGTDFGDSLASGIAYAQDHWADFESLITFYDTNSITNAVPGYWVEWNTEHDYTGITTNGMGVASDYVHEIITPHITFIDNYADVLIDKTIIFHSPGNPDFIIKKKCANLAGAVGGIAFPPGFEIAPDITTTDALAPGGTYNFSATAQNLGTSTGDFQMNITRADPPTPEYPGGVSVGPVVITQPGVLSLGTNGTGSRPFQVTIPATSVGGSYLCMRNTVTPGASDGTDRSSPKRCFKITALRTPQLATSGGNVHAGGGLGETCIPPAGDSGKILGSTGSPSYSEYAISGTDQISNFLSNGPSNNNLSFGAGGQYGVVCRSDLLREALDYDAANPGAPHISYQDVDLATIMAYPDNVEVIFLDHPNPRLTCISTCTISKKKTLVVSDASVGGGNLTINKNITNGGGNVDAHFLASLGIIVRNNIYIPSSVTRFDAYVFSSEGVIDTCSNASIGSTACSTSPLTMSGFLMAHDIYFKRLGAQNTGGAQVAEQITLNPQIYLNPPKLFDGAALVDVMGQGERSPLY